MNPAAFRHQVRRAWAIARKDIRIYYYKGPVLIFGVFMPVFLFLAFFLGGRHLPLAFLLPGLVGMTLFFTSTAVSPAIFPWEGQARTLERLTACPITIEAIVLGDMIASILFGLGVTMVTILIGLGLGLVLQHGIVLGFAMLLAACCFSAFGMLLAVPPHEHAFKHHDALDPAEVPARLHLRNLYSPGVDAGVGASACILLTAHLLHRPGAILICQRPSLPGGG